eukprot:537695_1
MDNKGTRDTQRELPIEEDNINQICLCGRKLTNCPFKFHQCKSCCKEVEKEEKGYYFCNAEQCTYSFIICGACYENVTASNIDAKHSFLFRKVASLIEQIRKETKQCNNNDQRRRYMFYVHWLLYQSFIAKLKEAFVKESEYEEIKDLFNAFYG